MIIIGIAFILFQASLIRAEGYDSSSISDEDYDDEESSEISNVNSTDHWRNCTFNGTVYFDDECAEWMRTFYIILSFSVAGMILFVLIFLYCAKKYCSRNGDDTERLISFNQNNFGDYERIRNIQ